MLLVLLLASIFFLFNSSFFFFLFSRLKWKVIEIKWLIFHHCCHLMCAVVHLFAGSVEYILLRFDWYVQKFAYKSVWCCWPAYTSQFTVVHITNWLWFLFFLRCFCFFFSSFDLFALNDNSKHSRRNCSRRHCYVAQQQHNNFAYSLHRHNIWMDNFFSLSSSFPFHRNRWYFVVVS